VLNFYQKIQEKRHLLDFEIDGIVVKLNHLENLKKAGFIARSPRGMSAFKYPATQTTTRIESVFFQVGRTGVITPVAHFHPTALNGVMIKKATLHNQDFIAQKDIHIGDTVFIRRAGDVIPEVISVILSKRAFDAKAVVFPENCPCCQTFCIQDPEQAAIRCPNPDCPDQLFEQLAHFCSKDALNIQGCAKKILQRLIEAKLVFRPSDLFSLKKEDLLDLRGFSEKSASNLIAAIQEARITEKSRVIFGLGIRHVGKQTASLLAQDIAELKDLLGFSLEVLLRKDQIGEKIAHTLFEKIQEPDFVKQVLSLQDLLTFSEPQKSKLSFFSQKICVITGSFSCSRDELTRKLEQAGALIRSSVTSKTDYLLMGEDPGSKKQKAEKLGVEILTEEQFFHLF
jgi:DNA ligase (NAD+)